MVPITRVYAKNSGFHAQKGIFLESEHGVPGLNWHDYITQLASFEGGAGEWMEMENFQHEAKQVFATVGGGEMYFGMKKSEKVTPVFPLPSLKTRATDWVPDATICQGISVTFIHNANCEGQLEYLTRDEWKKSFDIREDDPALRDEDIDLDNFNAIRTLVDRWVYIPDWKGWIPQRIQYLTSADTQQRSEMESPITGT